jgi:ERF superfamily
MSRALAKPKIEDRPRTDATNPMSLIQYAIDKDNELDAGKLKELMDLADRWQAREAAREFGEKLAHFQAEVPQIEKTREVNKKDGGLIYRFANLEDVDREVKPVKERFGLATSGSIRTTPEGVTVEWTLQIGSHKETRSFMLPNVQPAGIVQNANATQNLGAWMTYLWRYTYCMALGVVVRGEDTDANLIREATLIDPPTVETVEGWLANGAVSEDGKPIKLDRKKLLDWLQADRPEDKRSVETLTTGQFETLLSTFKIRHEAKAKGGAA